MEIIWIRHTAVAVPKGVCYGQADVPLLETFPMEAEQVYRSLQLYAPFDAVYSSPLSRCVRLATYGGNFSFQTDNRLLELNFGAWEMQRYDAIRDTRLQEWYEDYLHVAPTGGESFEQQLQRVASFLDELCTLPYQRVAVFTHGGVIACALVYTGQVRVEEVFSHVPPFGGIVSMVIESSFY